MKKAMLLFTAAVLVSLTACEEKTDIEKEKNAIKAVFEQEKAGFFNTDAEAMAETWIQEPSSVKIYFLDNGQRSYEGWNAIKKHDAENLADSTWDRSKFTLTFRDYKIELLGDNAAWVMCQTQWDGIENNEPVKLIQTRINILKKDQGKWKFALMAIYNQP